MKTFVCLLLLAAAACGAEEKKNEKRGLLGLGYGLSSAPLIGHGLGLDYGLAFGGHALDLGYGGHDLGLSYGSHSVLGAAPVISHSVLAAAPVISHGVYTAPSVGHGLYGGKLSYGAPLLALGHGYLH